MAVLAVLVVVVAAVGLAAVGMVTTVRNRALRGGLVVVGGAFGGLIVVVAVLAVLGGGRRSVGPGERADPTSTTVRDRAPTVDDGLLRLAATDPLTPPDSVPVLDRLEDGQVLRVRVTGFDPVTPGDVRQCRLAPAGFTQCRNTFPVHATEGGVVTFQYQLTADGGRCGADGSCALVVRSEGHQAFAYTVFGDSAPPRARLSLDPAGPFREGERVTVTGRGLPPGTAAAIALCAPRCEQIESVRATERGSARATLTMRPRCGGTRCVVVLFGSGARDARAPVRFVPPTRPEHDPARMTLGLSAAGAALLLAWIVARRTDWEPPSEAATPALDAAEL